MAAARASSFQRAACEGELGDRARRRRGEAGKARGLALLALEASCRSSGLRSGSAARAGPRPPRKDGRRSRPPRPRASAAGSMPSVCGDLVISAMTSCRTCGLSPVEPRDCDGALEGQGTDGRLDAGAGSAGQRRPSAGKSMRCLKSRHALCRRRRMVSSPQTGPFRVAALYRFSRLAGLRGVAGAAGGILLFARHQGHAAAGARRHQRHGCRRAGRGDRRRSLRGLDAVPEFAGHRDQVQRAPARCRSTA